VFRTSVCCIWSALPYIQEVGTLYSGSACHPFLAVACLNLKMEAATRSYQTEQRVHFASDSVTVNHSSVMSVDVYLTAQHHAREAGAHCGLSVLCFLLPSCSACSSASKMEAVCSSDVSRLHGIA
jgi:hypothetical protein